MIPTALLQHYLPQRARFSIPSKKNNLEYFLKIKKKLSKNSIIDGIQINPRTGSLLIYYQKNFDEIVRYAKQNRLFIIKQKTLTHQRTSPSRDEIISPSTRMLQKLSKFNFEMLQNTQGGLDLTTLAIGSLIGLGAYQAYQGKLLPPAWTLFSQVLSVIRFQKGVL